MLNIPINAIYIAEYHQHVGVHHIGYKTGKFIVVREHQFRYAYGIVLVYDRNDAVFEHYLHALLLVPVFHYRIEIFLHGKDLADGNAVLVEKLGIMIDEAHLADGGIELALFHAVETMAGFDDAASARHGAAGNYQDVKTFALEDRNLVDEGGHSCNIE